MAVRTKQLAHGVCTTTLTTVYTVPAGETCILKGVTIYNPAGAATTAFFLSALCGGAARGITLWGGLAANNAIEFSHWVVLNAGDSLRVSANPNAAVQFILSGTELEGVAD